MRALKTILVIIAALVGLWLLLSLIGPKEAQVERRITIKAAPETIYDYIRYLKSMDEWGVWRKSDPNAKYEFVGEDGTVGAKESWDGEVVHQGSNTITALEPNKSVKTDLAFGDMMVSQVSLDLVPKGDSTEVIWSLHGILPFMFRAPSLFMGNERVEKDFDTGLANLKGICEARQAEANMAAAAVPTYEIMTGDRPAATYVGIKSSPKLPQAEIGKFYMENSPKVFAALEKAKVQPAGPLCGLYYDWDEKNMTTSMMVCVPVAEGTKVAGLETDKLAPSTAYWTVLKGGYDGMKPAHDALGARITADNMDQNAAVLEEYVVGPGSEQDSTKWVTNIIYNVKPKS